MKCINLISGPGCGKSTTASLLFAKMKLNGYKVELVTEYAKDMVYENRMNILEDQLYILAKQSRRLSRLKGQVDYVVTDSPLLLTLIYNKQSKTINDLCLELYNEYDNINIFLKREKPYQNYGRTQTEEQARKIDENVLNMLENNQLTYYIVNANEKAGNVIFNIINNIRETKELLKGK